MAVQRLLHARGAGCSLGSAARNTWEARERSTPKPDGDRLGWAEPAESLARPGLCDTG